MRWGTVTAAALGKAPERTVPVQRAAGATYVGLSRPPSRPGTVVVGTAEVGVGAAVVGGVVASGEVVFVVDASRASGLGGWPGTPTTWTGMPMWTWPGNHSAALIGMRTQPWEAGWAGTDFDPWTAMPPLK